MKCFLMKERKNNMMRSGHASDGGTGGYHSYGGQSRIF